MSEVGRIHVRVNLGRAAIVYQIHIAIPDHLGLNRLQGRDDLGQGGSGKGYTAPGGAQVVIGGPEVLEAEIDRHSVAKSACRT
jgi:hypothetical protein